MEFAYRSHNPKCLEQIAKAFADLQRARFVTNGRQLLINYFK